MIDQIRKKEIGTAILASIKLVCLEINRKKACSSKEHMYIKCNSNFKWVLWVWMMAVSWMWEKD